jgi:hypothetical protein
MDTNGCNFFDIRQIGKHTACQKNQNCLPANAALLQKADIHQPKHSTGNHCDNRRAQPIKKSFYHGGMVEITQKCCNDCDDDKTGQA